MAVVYLLEKSESNFLKDKTVNKRQVSQLQLVMDLAGFQTWMVTYVAYVKHLIFVCQSSYPE